MTKHFGSGDHFKHFDSGDHFKHFSGLGYKTFTKSNHSDFSQNLEIKKNILKVKSEHSQISVLRLDFEI